MSNNSQGQGQQPGGNPRAHNRSSHQRQSASWSAGDTGSTEHKLSGDTRPTETTTTNDTHPTEATTTNDRYPTEATTTNDTQSTEATTTNDTQSTENTPTGDTRPPRRFSEFAGQVNWIIGPDEQSTDSNLSDISSTPSSPVPPPRHDHLHPRPRWPTDSAATSPQGQGFVLPPSTLDGQSQQSTTPPPLDSPPASPLGPPARPDLAMPQRAAAAQPNETESPPTRPEGRDSVAGGTAKPNASGTAGSDAQTDAVEEESTH